MDEEEQVVGVVKFCDVCGEKTVHVDGVCRDHKIVRRRKQVVEEPLSEEAAPRPAPVVRRKKKKKQPSRVGQVFAFLVVGALIAGMGMIHIVYGSIGFKVCKKDGFSLKHTIVNYDDEKNAAKPDVALLKTLTACGISR